MRIIKLQVVPVGIPLSAQSSLEAFNRLSEWANDFVDGGWSAEEVFWSRYFWICTYANFVRARTGPEAALEQFLFRFLERPSPYCEPDWAWADRIVEMSRCETARWLTPNPKLAAGMDRFGFDAKADGLEPAAVQAQQWELVPSRKPSLMDRGNSN